MNADAETGNDDRLRTDVESAPNALVLIDPGGKIALVNSHTERLFQYRHEELLGQSAEILVPERFRSASAAGPASSLHGRVLGGGREFFARRKDGSEVAVEIGLSPVATGSGICVLASVVDITARNKLEESLVDLASIVRSSSDAISSKTLDGTILTWNAGAEAIYGYRAAEVVGQSIAVLSPKDRVDEVPTILQKLCRDERVENYETIRVRKDGVRIVVSLTVSPILDRSGKLIAASSIARDITIQRRTEERLRVLVESAPSAIVMVDDRGRIVLVNAQTERLFGYDRAHLLEQPVDMLLPARFHNDDPFYRPAYFTNGLSRVLGAGGEMYGLRRDGLEVPIEITLNPLTTDEGSFVLAAVADITERKRAAAELAHKTEEVEAFVYTVSHDLRAPLVNLQGFSRELAICCQDLRRHIDGVTWPADVEQEVHRILDEDIPLSLRFISASTSKFERLINALLGLSRSGRQEYRMEAVDVCAVVRTTLDSLRQSINQSGAVVDDTELPAAWADRTAVGQIFANLITNAVNFLDPTRPGRIEIGGRSEAGASHYWVKDNGVGIPQAAGDRLFRVFQRFHPDMAAGDGMGLASIKRIVDRHGGKVWVESVEGRGATFHVLLPATESEARRVGH